MRSSLLNLRGLCTKGLLVSISSVTDQHLIGDQMVELHITRYHWSWWRDIIISCTGWRVSVHALAYEDRFWISAEP